MADAAFRVFGVGGGSARRDHNRRQALTEELVGVIKAGTKHGRGTPIVLGGAENNDCVGWTQVLLLRIMNDRGNNRGEHREKKEQCAQRRPEQPETRLAAGRRHHPLAKNSEISCEAIAPSRRIFQRASSSVKSTMVEDISRGDVPPSTMMGIRIPS